VNEFVAYVELGAEIRQNRPSFETARNKLCAGYRKERNSAMATILLLHGPNLNLLGMREPDTYGSVTIETINQRLASLAVEAGHHLQTLQSNAEHELIERIHAARSEGISHIIFNPAGYTHTSVALRDALLAVAVPFIEVHISNVHAREPFRHHSYFSDIAAGVICGFGPLGYELAMHATLARIQST
jgi:3-dehydroquinate dehydratase II